MRGDVGGETDRIDGWKAIGGYFRRDRSTVIRWARDKGMPVHRIAGAPTGSVYALRSELETWARGAALDEAGKAADADATMQAAPVTPSPPVGRRSWHRWALGFASIGAVLLAAAAAHDWSPAPSLPADPAAARLFLDARDASASREPPRIAAAIDKLHAVARVEPNFAPAHTALADAYLLAREFGALADPVAFPRAQLAAERAAALDPRHPAAHRALGFIAYWWERDTAAAGRAFRRALALDPDDAQTRFWYGNILADNGEAVAARRELDAARLLDPGSLAIETDFAWALWSAGETREAERRLRAVIARQPGFVAAYDALAVALLERGDLAGYLGALRSRARLRGEAGLASRVAALEDAMRAGGEPAMAARLVALARAEEQTAPFPDHSWAAFTASAVGDRAALMEVLALAERNRERWGSAGFRRAIAERWRADEAVQGALRRLAAAEMEPRT